MEGVKTYNIRNITLEVLLIAYLIAILYSKTLLTLVMGLLFLMAFVDLSTKKSFEIVLRKDIKSNLLSFFRSKRHLALTLVFFLVVISGLNSTNLQEWKHHLILKLPFALMPFAFYSVVWLSAKQYYRLYLYFIIIMFFSVIPVIFDYFIHKEDVDNIIKAGRIINTPIDHIRYSLLLAFSVAASFILYTNDYFNDNKRIKTLIGLIGIFNFVALHILAVRSGLIIVYLLILFLIVKYRWDTKKRHILIFLTILFIFPVFSYKYIDSFKNKLEYMKHDYNMHLQDKGHDYSDSERFYSYKIGLEIFKENIFAGTGIGDLKEKCIEAYKKIYPAKELNFKYPHNQFLFILAGSGILGLVLFLIAIYYPLFYPKTADDPFFIGFMILITLSFFVENSIERSYSIGMYLFFVLIALNRSGISGQNNNQQPEKSIFTR